MRACSWVYTYHPVVVLGAARHGIEPGPRGPGGRARGAGVHALRRGRPAARRRVRREPPPGLRGRRRRDDRVLGGEGGVLRHCGAEGGLGAERKKVIQRSSGNQANARTSNAEAWRERRLDSLEVLGGAEEGAINRCGRPGVSGAPRPLVVFGKKTPVSQQCRPACAGRRRAEITVQLGG
jgi:hypothetical protein